MHVSFRQEQRVETIGNTQTINGVRYVCTSSNTLQTLELRLRLRDNAQRLGLQYGANGQISG